MTTLNTLLIEIEIPIGKKILIKNLRNSLFYRSSGASTCFDFKSALTCYQALLETCPSYKHSAVKKKKNNKNRSKMIYCICQ